MVWKGFRWAASLVEVRTVSSQYVAVDRSDGSEPDNDWPEDPPSVVTEKTREAGLRYLLALTCGVGGYVFVGLHIRYNQI